MKEEISKCSKLGNIEFFKRGKVREIYNVENDLLMIATDRISCFDVVLPTPIDLKGEVLTRLSVFWFDLIKDIVASHFITANVEDFPEELQKYKDILKGRSMLVKKAKPFPVECIVRGYLSGSGWKEYQEKQSVCGIKLPEGLKESDKLPEPIFTPSTKAEEGDHDENVSEEYIENLIGQETTQKLKEISLAVYKKASEYARTKGIIIADTKFEFGEIDGEIAIIDEVLTPDSSRFWPKESYAPGQGQPSFDKQYVRDYLETLDWDKTDPGPELPQEIVKKTTDKYVQAFKKIADEQI